MRDELRELREQFAFAHFILTILDVRVMASWRPRHGVGRFGWFLLRLIGGFVQFRPCNTLKEHRGSNRGER